MATNAELTAAILGSISEPKIDKDFNLVRALAWYAREGDLAKLKDWSIEWCEKNAPQLVQRVKAKDKTFFGTYGALCRMHLRGMLLDAKTRARIENFFNAFDIPKSEVKVEVKVSSKYQAKGFNKLIDAFYDVEKKVPGALSELNKMLEKAPYDSEFVSFVKRVKAQNEEDAKVEDVIASDRSEFIAELCESVIRMQESKKVSTAPRKLNIDKMVKEVKYQREDAETGLKSMSVADVVNRKKLYVYDSKNRQLICFVSNSTFMFSGTTMQNVDFTKSFAKTVRKPKELFGGFKTEIGISELNKMFKELATKEKPVESGRMNSFCVLLNAS